MVVLEATISASTDQPKQLQQLQECLCQLEEENTQAKIENAHQREQLQDKLVKYDIIGEDGNDGKEGNDGEDDKMEGLKRQTFVFKCGYNFKNSRRVRPVKMGNSKPWFNPFLEWSCIRIARQECACLVPIC